MKRHVVDTNVLVVANGRISPKATPRCREAAIDALMYLLESGQIIMDWAGEMTTEYRTYCNASGQPGVGDRFFQEVLTSHASGKLERIDLVKRDDGSFIDFPDDPDLKKDIVTLGMVKDVEHDGFGLGGSPRRPVSQWNHGEVPLWNGKGQMVRD